MKKQGILALLPLSLEDKRSSNRHIPFDTLLALAVTAKLKQKTSLTDVPFAVTEAEVLAELGWKLWDHEQGVNEGIFSETVMRRLLSKYTSGEWVSFYHSYVQKCLVQKLDIQPCIHILDCTKSLVTLDNEGTEKV